MEAVRGWGGRVRRRSGRLLRPNMLLGVPRGNWATTGSSPPRHVPVSVDRSNVETGISYPSRLPRPKACVAAVRRHHFRDRFGLGPGFLDLIDALRATRQTSSPPSRRRLAPEIARSRVSAPDSIMCVCDEWPPSGNWCVFPNFCKLCWQQRQHWPRV